MNLTTTRLTLRRPEADDWDAFCAYFTSDRSATLGGPNSVGQSWRIFALHLGHWAVRGYGNWAVTRRGERRAIGLVGPWFPVDWPEREIGWTILDAEAEGKGYAHEAAQAALDHAFATLGWATAVSYVNTQNTRSRALAERLGAAVDPGAACPASFAEPHLVYRHRGGRA